MGADCVSARALLAHCLFFVVQVSEFGLSRVNT